MSRPSMLRRPAPGLILAITMALACSSGGDDGPTGNGGDNFSIQVAASPSALSVQQGGTGTVNLTLTRGGGFTGSVSVSVSGLPSGVTASVSPSPLTGTTTSAVVTVNVAASVAPGMYTATITASATGVGSATATYQLTVTALPVDYALSASPAAVTAAASGSAVTTVSVARTNFAGAVALTLDNPPAGITGSFNPASTTGTSSQLTVNVAATVAPGTYPVTVKGSATGPGDRTTQVMVTVTDAPNYTLSVDPAVVTVTAGMNGNATVNIARTNFTGAVTLSLLNPPNGVSGSFNPVAPTGNQSTLTVTVDNAVAPGDYIITVMGAATGVPTRLAALAKDSTADAEIAAAAGDRTTTFQLTVTQASGITVAVNPGTVQALQGGIALTAATITRTGFAGNVNLAASGAPAGMLITFDPNGTTGDAATATVLVGPGVPVGSHAVTITGSGTGITDAMTTLTVDVSAPPLAPNITISFVGDVIPEYFAFKNGAAGWQPVLPLFDQGTGTFTFAMDMSAGYGGLTYVFDNPGPAATLAALFRSGALGPEEAFGGSGLLANQLRMAASVAGELTGPGKITVQSFGTPLELNTLGNYVSPSGSWVDITASVTNGGTDTRIWAGGRQGLFDGSMNPISIDWVDASRLSDGAIATRFDGSGIPDRFVVRPSIGLTATFDMDGFDAELPAFTSVFTSPSSGLTGGFTHLWRNNRFVGLADIQAPTINAVKNLAAPPVSSWGSGGAMGLTVYETDNSSYKKKFTGIETNWGTKSTFFPSQLNTTVSPMNGGYNVSFNAPTEFGNPFQAFFGAIFQDDFTGNAYVGTSTRSYYNLSGQSGPNYSYDFVHPSITGAPLSSALGSSNVGVFGVTHSANVLSDGITPAVTPGSFHTQSFSAQPGIGYPGVRRR